jgi:hypothetical protein
MIKSTLICGNLALASDVRFVDGARGVHRNRVYVKETENAPEFPLAGARVDLYKLQDGRRAWTGFSDTDGYYAASGLEIGLKYIPVAVDPTGQFECAASGPVVAMADDA